MSSTKYRHKSSGKVKVAAQILLVRPPFPWDCIRDAQRECSASIETAGARLRTVREFADGAPNTWKLHQIPWLSALIAAASSANRSFPNIDTGDSVSLKDHDRFIDWLICAICEPPTNREIVDGLERYRSIIREKRVFSFQDTGAIDLEYYPHEIVMEELSKLVHTLKSQTQITPIVLVAGIFAHFISIHPFMDGNGRAARRLVFGLLRKLGLWGSAPLPLPFLLYRDRMHHVKSMRTLVVQRNAIQYISHMMSLMGASAELSVLVRYFHPEEPSNIHMLA